MGRELLVTVTEARMRLAELVRGLAERRVLLLRHGRPVGVILDYEGYAEMLEHIEDLQDRLSIYESRETPPDVRVPWEKVKAETGLLSEG